MIKLVKIFASILILLMIQSGSFVIDPSENAVSHNSYGVFYFKIEDYPAAIQEFKMAIALSPDAASTASFYNNLGLVYLKIHRYDWARSCFNISISMSPNFLEYYVNLVKSYKGKKQLGTLANNYNKTLKKKRNDYIIWLMLGLINKEQNKKTEAIKCFKEFKKLGPDDLLGAAVDNLVRNMR